MHIRLNWQPSLMPPYTKAITPTKFNNNDHQQIITLTLQLLFKMQIHIGIQLNSLVWL